MSRTIDEEVVKMSLDTKEFEKDISSSISSIEKLKSAFNFESVAQGVSQLGSTIASIGTSLGSSVVNVAKNAIDMTATVGSGVLSIGKTGASVLSTIGSGVVDIASKATSTGSSIISGIGSIASKATSVVGEIGSTILAPFASLGEKMFGGVSAAAEKELFGPAMWIQQEFWHKVTDLGLNAAHEIWSAFSSITFDQIGAGFGKYGDILKSQKTIMAAGYDLEKVEQVLAKVQWYTDNTSYSLNDMTSNIGKFTAAGVDLDDAATAMIGIANAAARAGQGSAEAGRVMYNISQSLGMGYMQLLDWKSVENANMATLEFKQTLIDAGVELGMLIDLGNGMYKTLDKGTEFEAKKLRETLSEKWLTSDVLLQALKKYGAFVDDVYELAGDGSMTVTDAIKKLEGQMGLAVDSAEESVETIGRIVNTTALDSGYLQAAIEVVRGNYGNNMAERFRMLEEAGFEAQKVQDIVNRAFAEGITSTQGMIDAYSDLVIETGEVTEAAGAVAQGVTSLGVESFKAAQQAITFQKAMDMTKEAAGSAWASVFKVVFGDLNQATELWTKFAETLNDILIKPVKELKEKLLVWDKRGGRQDILDALATGFTNISSILGNVSKAFSQVFPPSTGNTLAKLSKQLKAFISSLTLNEDQLHGIYEISLAVFKVIDLIKYSLGALFRFMKPSFDALFSALGPTFEFLRQIAKVVMNLSTVFKSNDLVFKGLQSVTEGIVKRIKDLDSAFKSFWGFSILEKLGAVTDKVRNAFIWLHDAVLAFIKDHQFFQTIFDVKDALEDLKVALDVGKLIDNLKKKITDYVGHLDEKFTNSYGFSFLEKLKPLIDLAADAFNAAKQGISDFFKQFDMTNIGTFTKSISDVFGGFSIKALAGDLTDKFIDWFRDLDTEAIASSIRAKAKAIADVFAFVFSEETLADPKRVITAFVEFFSEKFTKFKMWAKEEAPKISAAISGFATTIFNAIKEVLIAFGVIKAEASDEVEGLEEEIDGELVQIKNAITSPIELIKGVIAKVKALDLSPIQAVFATIGGVIAMPFVAIGKAFDTLAQTIRGLENIDTSAFDEFLANMAAYKDAFVTWIYDFFTGLGPAIKSGWDNLKAKVQGITGSIADGFGKFITSIGDAFKLYLEGIKTFGKSVAGGFSDLITGLGNFGTWLVETANKIGLKVSDAFTAIHDFVVNSLGITTLDDVITKLSKFVAIFGGVGLTNVLNGLAKAIAKFSKVEPESLNKFFSSFGNFNLKFSGLFDKETQTAITETLTGVKDVLKSYQKEIKYKAFKEIAQGVLILAAGILVLTMIPKDKLMWPAIIVGGLFTAISLMTRLMKGMESLPTAGAVVAIAGGVLAFAIAITVIVKALERLKNTVGDGNGNGNTEFVVALSVLAGILAGMVGVMVYMSKIASTAGTDMLKTGASLLLVALAVDMMIGALMVLQIANPLKLLASAVSIGAIIVLLGVGLRAAAKPDVLKGAAALLIAAAAIDLLLVSLLALTAVFAVGGGDHLWDSIFVLIAAIVTLAVPLAILAGFGPNVLYVAAAFLVMAVSVDVVANALLKGVAAFAAFSLLGPEAIQKGAANLEMFIGYLPGIIMKLSDTISAMLLLITSKAPEIAIALLSIVGSFFAMLGASFAEVILEPLIGILLMINEHAEEIARILSEILVNVINGIEWYELGQAVGNLIGDFFGGLFGADRETLELMENNVSMFATSLAQWIGQLFEDLTTGAFWTYVWEGIKKLGAAIVQGFKDIFGIASPSTVLQEIGQFLLDGLVEGLKAIPESFNKALAAIGKAIHDFFLGDDSDPESKGLLGSLFDAGGKLMEELGKGIANAIDAVLRKCGPIGIAIADYFAGIRADASGNTMEDRMNNAGWDVTEMLGDGMESNTTAMPAALGVIATSAETAAAVPGSGLYDRLKAVGSNVADGLILGITQKDYDAVMEGVNSHLENGLMGAAECSSPSKLYRRIGGYIGEGLVLGVNDWNDNAVHSVVRLSDNMAEIASDTFGQISDILDNTLNTNPTIRPSVDLTDVAAATGYMSSMFYDPTLSPLATTAGRGMLGSDIKIQNGGTDLTKVLESIAGLRGDFSTMSDRVSNLRVQMDTGALVGSIVEPLDSRLGSRLAYARRGIN